MSTGDVTVLGVTMGDHVLEDIQMSVPQGMIVTIPAELALRSKHLWQAIAQKSIMRIHSGAIGAPIQVAPHQSNHDVVIAALTDQNKQLHQTLEEQRAMNAAILEQLRLQTEAFKVMMAKVEATGVQVRVVSAQPAVAGIPAAILPDDTPTFIPSSIKPVDAEVRIESKTEESSATNIASNRSKLRSLRK
jgi:hypothetical protein